MNSPEFRRMWINSPSTHHSTHCYHGMNVLALLEDDGKTLIADGKDPQYVRVAFIAGDSESIRINKMYLSRGWLPS